MLCCFLSALKWQEGYGRAIGFDKEKSVRFLLCSAGEGDTQWELISLPPSFKHNV